ncbi:NAD-specific glutamate dehydrogenase [Brucella pinnipedialis B2/94]|nr:NAD-specific glutamate dehydrogenase [Brucella pinnipedialis B2/94]
MQFSVSCSVTRLSASPLKQLLFCLSGATVPKTGKSPGISPGLSTHGQELRRLLVVVDFFVVGIDHIVLGRRGLFTALGTRTFGSLRCFVHGLTKLHGNFGKGLGLRLDILGVFTFKRGLEGCDRILNGLLVIGRNLVAIFGQRLFGRMDQAFGLILGFDALTTLLVGLGIGFGVLDHLFDVGIAQAARSLNADLVLLAGTLILGRNVDDAVGVDVEGHFDLRHTARCGRNANEVELSKQLVIGCHFTLALEDADRHGRLVVLSRGEGLRLLGRDSGVAFDQAGEHAAQRFNAERKRGHVEQQHVLDVALQNAALDRRAHGHDFIRVHALVRFLAEEGLHDFLNLGHAGHAADQNHFVNFASLEAGILERRLARLDRALHEIIDQAFKLGARQLDRQMLRASLVSRDERQVDFGLLRGRQFDLGLFGSFLEALQGKLVVLQVDATFLLELGNQIFDQTNIEVFTAKERVAIGGLHFKNAVADFQNRHVESTAAKVIDSDGLAFALVETIGKRSRGRLVDDAQNFQTGDLAGILGGLTLGVVEVGRNRDDGLRNGFAKVGFSRFLHLLKDHGGDLRRRIFLAVHLDPGIAIVALDDLVRNKILVLGDHRIVIATANQALDGKKGAFRVGDGLTLRRLTSEAFVTIGEGDDRRGGACTFCIFNDLRVLSVHDGNAGVGRSQIDTNNFSHISLHSANCQDLDRAFHGQFLSVFTMPASRLGSRKRTGFRPVIKALCEAYIRKAVFHCKSQEPDKNRFLAPHSLQASHSLAHPASARGINRIDEFLVRPGIFQREERHIFTPRRTNKALRLKLIVVCIAKRPFGGLHMARIVQGDAAMAIFAGIEWRMNLDEALIAMENHALAAGKLRRDIEGQVEPVETGRNIGVAVGSKTRIIFHRSAHRERLPACHHARHHGWVNTDIRQGPSAKARLVAHIAGIDIEIGKHTLHMTQIANRAFGQKRAQLDPLRVVIDHEGFRNRDAMPVARFDELVYIARAKRNGLFAQHMLACFGGLQCPFDMLGCRQRNIDTVHFLAGQQFLIGTESERRAEAAGNRACARMVAACYCMDHTVIRSSKCWNNLCDADFRGGKYTPSKHAFPFPCVPFKQKPANRRAQAFIALSAQHSAGLLGDTGDDLLR